MLIFLIHQKLLPLFSNFNVETLPQCFTNNQELGLLQQAGITSQNLDKILDVFTCII